jgi:hypothetical protein
VARAVERALSEPGEPGRPCELGISGTIATPDIAPRFLR